MKTLDEKINETITITTYLLENIEEMPPVIQLQILTKFVEFANSLKPIYNQLQDERMEMLNDFLAKLCNIDE